MLFCLKIIAFSLCNKMPTCNKDSQFLFYKSSKCLDFSLCVKTGPYVKRFRNGPTAKSIMFPTLCGNTVHVWIRFMPL